jgi:hypothetical protein
MTTTIQIAQISLIAFSFLYFLFSGVIPRKISKFAVKVIKFAFAFYLMYVFGNAIKADQSKRQVNSPAAAVSTR